MQTSALSVDTSTPSAMPGLSWVGEPDCLAWQEGEIRDVLLEVEQPIWAVQAEGGVAIARGGWVQSAGTPGGSKVLAFAPAVAIQGWGDPAFCRVYGTRHACYGGAMANGISSVEMVIALGKAGMMGSFGAAGLAPARVEAAILAVQKTLPGGPYAFNLIFNPNEPALEQRAVELYLQYGVGVVEASAYLDLTLPLVQYRLSGLSQAPSGEVLIGRRLIAKCSRKEVAKRFMEPAPADLVNQLLVEGKISRLQAELAQHVPLADDITVEADSGGHTDNRPLVGLIPSMLALRDEIQAKQRYPVPVRIGAAGGISTPAATLAAFMLGAAYVVTGSVNQACVESGACAHVKNLLAQADMADVIMAPAADMFEMGVRVQLLKRGTLYPLRAQKLYDLYTHYDSIDEIPTAEREKLEKQIFRSEVSVIWEEVVRFFGERDPRQIERACNDPRQKMAFIFRWYLGLSSRWAVIGEKGREMDYQIWCGPAMGAFNEWARGTYLAEPANRHVVDVALHLFVGCSYLYRVRLLESQGIRLPAVLQGYVPTKPFN
jgi:trans-AT polyketide synthase/acyltransferase/oxidoreductase domain-containing protein